MSDDRDAPLPTLQETVLEGQAIDAWLDDVRDHAALHTIVFRGGRFSDEPLAVTPEDAPARLREAGELLRRGASVQLRYAFEDSEWWDTLMPLEPGRVRLVRIDRGTLGRPR